MGWIVVGAARVAAVILVTGATGNVGREVVAELLGAGVEVRALTRKPGSASLPADVEVVQGDLSKPGSLTRALTGVTAVFFIWPLPTAKAATAIVRSIGEQASRIVYLSSMSVRDDVARQSDPISGVHFEIERLIERSGAKWTFLRPSGFATNALVWAQQIRAGDIVRWPYGKARRSLIDERDIAGVAVRVLLDEGHASSTYKLTGPHALTHIEQLAVIGEAIGRELRYEEIPPAAARQALLTSWGIPRIAARLLPARTLPRQMADGVLAAYAEMVTDPEAVTATVEAVTGRAARTFGDWAKRHVHNFQ
jgi:uncharacterized protein YbjT (DUF2867 family)